MIIEEADSPFNGRLTVERDIAWGVHIRVGGLTQSGGIVSDVWKTVLERFKNYDLGFKRCLILGLGGGSVAKLINNFWPSTHITGIDIDSVIVQLGKKYLGLDKLNINIIISDAKYLILNTKYDLICIDMYKGENVPEEFNTLEFIKKIKKLLTKDGVAIFNRLYGPEDRLTSMQFGKKLEKVFKQVDYVYPQANVMFVCYNKA